MSEFVKEARYIVLKLKDMAAAGLTDEEIAAFNKVCDKVSEARKAAGKPLLGCVVVEADWRIYSRVWDMVRAEHEADEVRKVCAAEGHLLRRSQVADGTYCARCREWVPE